jgi:phospholipase C
MGELAGVLAVMTELRRLFALPENDFAWSSWRDQRAALADIDRYIADLKQGAVPHLSWVFAPTGPLQEVSLRSGWGAECITLAERFDSEMAHHT